MLYDFERVLDSVIPYNYFLKFAKTYHSSENDPDFNYEALLEMYGLITLWNGKRREKKDAALIEDIPH